MIFRSIKWRLQLWHGMVLFLVLGGFGYTAFELQRGREYRRVEAELRERVALLVSPRRGGRERLLRARPPREDAGGPPTRLRSPEDRPLERGPEPPFGPGRPPEPRPLGEDLPPNLSEDVYHIIWRADGAVLRSDTAPENIARPERPHREPGPRLRTRKSSLELFEFTPRGDAILAGKNIEGELAALRRGALLLAFTGVGILAIGLAGGWWVASQAIRPIETISQTAVKIAAGDLTQRIPNQESASELGRLASILNSTFERLDASFSQQARFTVDVSHELRTPLAVVLSQTQMALARERPAAEYREALEACQRAAERMRRLAESLLQLARLDAGQEQVRREPLDLAAVVSQTIALLQPLATARELRLSSDLQPAECAGDYGKIEQITTNLLTNAITYNQPGGEVRASTRAGKDHAILEITDTGPGIPEEHLPRLFERFFRVDQSRNLNTGGSGLGLAITRALVNAHGGVIEVKSGAGKGTTFTVRLPLA